MTSETRLKLHPEAQMPCQFRVITGNGAADARQRIPLMGQAALPRRCLAGIHSALVSDDAALDGADIRGRRFGKHAATTTVEFPPP